MKSTSKTCLGITEVERDSMELIQETRPNRTTLKATLIELEEMKTISRRRTIFRWMVSKSVESGSSQFSNHHQTIPSQSRSQTPCPIATSKVTLKASRAARPKTFTWMIDLESYTQSIVLSTISGPTEAVAKIEPELVLQFEGAVSCWTAAATMTLPRILGEERTFYTHLTRWGRKL